ncbi:PIN domain-containing protein [Rhizobium ruizarguesonis]|uniref:PIN domain-containing protein n=1 Tax=Rhizobium ruizarguesonis TaxID=2081791 RepID=UPI0013EE51EF|nr:PIN domain-containing protein [Rhizobium ruizarguesonis]
MPITEEVDLSKLLADGQINAISVDTNIFDEKGLQLNGSVLLALSRMASLHFDFLLSGTVAREIRRHLERSATDALRSAMKAVGIALGAFDTKSPTRDTLIEQISGGQSAIEAAEMRFNDYLTATNCEVLDDPALVETATIFNAYFAGDAPFGTGAKKNEFPDALALFALEQAAVQRGKGMIIVSKDGDWRAYCEKSERLHLVPDIERAISLINDPPVLLRGALRVWMNDGDGHADLRGYVASAVERLEFSVEATASSGEMEAHAWAGELRDIDWPDPSEIDIIDLEPSGEGGMDVTLSLPLHLVVRVPVELEFSVWDSVDRESVGMGGRTIEMDEEVDLRANAQIRIHDLGGDTEEFVIFDCELDTTYVEIEMGEVDVFEPEDYDRN